MTPWIELLRAAVRPVVTVALTSAFVAAVFVRDADAAAVIAGPMGIALGFWFKERADRHEGNQATPI